MTAGDELEGPGEACEGCGARDHPTAECSRYAIVEQELRRGVSRIAPRHGPDTIDPYVLAREVEAWERERKSHT